MNIAFVQGGRPTTARLQTRFGPVRLFVGQVCGSVLSTEGRHRLRILKYAYRLTAEGADEPTLRWEYDSDPADPRARWCRRHLQGPAPLRFGRGGETFMNDLHVPTGWLPIEEVIRFCIVDLGVRPLSPGWHRVLEESYRLSLEQFVMQEEMWISQAR